MNCKEKMISYKSEISAFIKQFQYLKKSFWVLCLIYGLSFLSIIRANVYYIDDAGRSFRGTQGWAEFNRYISDFFSTILHTSHYMTDVSPLTQIVAVMILALSGVILIYLFTEEKTFSYWKIIAVLPLGLSPYFLECISYKYDAPYMSLSILAVLVPFLFLEQSMGWYFVFSILGTLVMCTTYQAASGIYPVMVVAIAFMRWNKKENIKEIFRFIGISVVAYGIALLVFRIFIMKEIDSYISSDMFPISRIVSGSLVNLKNYYKRVYLDFRIIWTLLVFILGAGYMILTIWKSKQKKWVAALMTPVAMAVMMYFTFGVYIALEKPLFNPRGMYGLGVLLAILAIQCVELEKKGVVRFVCLMLSWCFISFSFTYGNALKEQDWYLNFRMQLVISDLNSLDGIAENEKKILQLDGTAGYAPIVKRMKEEYPMVPRLVKNSFGDSGWYWDDYYFRHYFKLKNVKKDKTIDLREMDLPIIKDTMYHTIRGKDEYILIEIK